ncbi:MAG: fused MFS/spermidine synthase [Acidimicrobiales bacterium]|nr:fused MFS/spermidine synthase [Acidimicrobiales bacterium]
MTKSVSSGHEEPESIRVPTRARLTLALFVIASFLSASLLFLVQPLATKMLLPLLGGTPSVWNTAMVFFQGALLAGYSLAHLTLTRWGPRRQSLAQLGLLAVPCLLLPIGLPDGWEPPTSGSPVIWTLLSLAVMIGAPFLMLSTSSPTLQRWFSATNHPHAADPYFLYAAGNAGSLGALLGYPLVLEPMLALDTQARFWSIGYAVFVGLSVACALLLRRETRLRSSNPADTAEPRTSEQSETIHESAGGAEETCAPGTQGIRPTIDIRTRLRWIGLAAIPSALMLGVTHHIATDIASMPLLWVIPLSAYLVTFIIAFGSRSTRPSTIAARILKLLAVPLALSFLGFISSIWFELPLHLGVFVCAAMVAHGRLASERPAADHLTEFYLLLAIGGVIGGILTALIAPQLFSSVLEYPLAIVASLAILPRSIFTNRPGIRQKSLGDHEVITANQPGRDRLRFGLPRLEGRARVAVLGAVATALAIASVAIRSEGTHQALTVAIIVASLAIGGAYALARTSTGYASTIAVVLGIAILVPANPTRYSERTFFGIHRVYEDQTAGGRHVLTNGRTVHGMEDFTGPNAGIPLTYFHPTGPIGQWFESNSTREKPWSVGVIGLGSGALAWYGRPGDTFTYYEIDPAVTRIAKNPELFTFIPKSKAEVEIVIGDGRLALADATDARYDLLVIDAFSSDAIPLHLMTREALQLYVDRLTDTGVIAFHISNRYFDFEPVLTRLADDLAIYGVIQSDVATPEQSAEGKLDATWVLLARSPDHLSPVATSGKWRTLEGPSGAPLWTDQYSDLLHVFRWGG